MQFIRREPGRYLDAAVRVLATAGRPLTAREIAEEAMARGLIRLGTASPDAAMLAVLARHRYDGPIAPAADDAAEHGPARWTLRAAEGGDCCPGPSRARAARVVGPRSGPPPSPPWPPTCCAPTGTPRHSGRAGGATSPSACGRAPAAGRKCTGTTITADGTENCARTPIIDIINREGRGERKIVV